MLFYNISNGEDTLLLAAALNGEKSDKNNIGMIGMKNDFIKLDTQKLEEHFVLLKEDIFLDKSLKKDTN